MPARRTIPEFGKCRASGDAEALAVATGAAAVLLRWTAVVIVLARVELHALALQFDMVARFLSLSVALLSPLLLAVAGHYSRNPGVLKLAFGGAALQLAGAIGPVIACNAPVGSAIHSACDFSMQWPLAALSTVGMGLLLVAHKQNHVLLNRRRRASSTM